MPRHAYTLRVLFAVLSLLGLAVLPRLPVQLAPSGGGGASLRVQFSWAGASPEGVERHITARLEGVLSTVAGVKKVESTSGYGQGSVTLTLDPQAPVDELRVEVAGLLRQTWKQLPRESSYPELTLNTPNERDRQKPLLLLQLSGPDGTAQLSQYAEEQLKPRLATVPGVAGLGVYGGSRPEWVLTYDADILRPLGLSEMDLRQALVRHFRHESLGVMQTDNGRAFRVSLSPANERISWHFPVSNRVGRVVYLDDLVRISRQEPPANQFYRINGKTAVNLVLQATEGANQLRVAARVREQMAQLRLPAGYALSVEYDATDYIRENLEKLGVQSGVAVLILLAFTFLTVWNIRYVFVILLSTVVTLAISVLVFVVLGWLGFLVEIHLYSLAALTVSLGILIDNIIVMIDHYRRHRDLRVFPALLGATLTTCAGLVVVWFLPEESRQGLADFAVVLAVTLFVSLGVAVGFVPAVMEKKGRKGEAGKERSDESEGEKEPHFATVRGWARPYGRVIHAGLRFRSLPIVLAILAFGLPVFMLPNRLSESEGMANVPVVGKPLVSAYNATIGSEWYSENLQSFVNKWLGGTLRLFVNYVYEGSVQREPERTALYVIAELPNQSTPEQMDALFRRFEAELGQHDEIEQFVTQVNSGQQGSLVVYFRSPHDEGVFPYQLKNEAIRLSTEMSGVDWDIFGVGQGFSQRLNEEENPTFNVELRGYQYDQLAEQARVLKTMLEKHPRIQEVNINRSPGLFQQKSLYAFVLNPDPQTLALRNTSTTALFDYLNSYNARPQPDEYVLMGGQYEAIKFLPVQGQTTDIWQLTHQAIRSGGATLQLSEMDSIRREKIIPEILKEDQQYRRLVSFQYYGSYTFGDKFLDKTLAEFRPQLPLGYTIKKRDQFWFGEDARTPYELLALVVLLIYGVCAVIFESLWQPLALIALIPLSYTGVFLAFYWTDANFDQGGYASLVLLAGNVVCAGIFIVAELNRLRREQPDEPVLNLYLTAFRHKIRPILLTVLSTVAGMIPFLLYEREPFWYALGIGTIGGLLMSLVAVILYLPLMLLPIVKPTLIG